jgi:lysophospholipase L1-like esterase
VNRRRFLVTAAAATTAAAVSAGAAMGESRRPSTTATSQPSTVPADVVWHNVRDWGVEGRAFDDTESFFDRLPARAKAVVRDAVWNLARNTSGMSVRFETDATAIYLRLVLTSPRLAMAHMPASGVSGLDLYGRLETGGWRWLQSHRPSEPAFEGELQRDIAPGRRLYQLYLPLYNGVKSLAIGVSKSAAFAPVAPRDDKPILFYGTSITQGASASRPGMSFVNILGRRLDRPMLNFGFSGNGRMEIEVGKFLAELDPAIFVIDCVANTDAGQIIDRCPPLVKHLRAAHPQTPILLLDERTWDNAPLMPYLAERHRAKAAALRQAYELLRADGVEHLHFRKGDDVLGHDGEATTDGSHPNDLGMMRYADAIEPDLRRLLT